jgi:hypothetical protein
VLANFVSFRKLEESVIRKSLFKYVIAHESLYSALSSLALKAYKTTQVLLKDRLSALSSFRWQIMWGFGGLSHWNSRTLITKSAYIAAPQPADLQSYW